MGIMAYMFVTYSPSTHGDATHKGYYFGYASHAPGQFVRSQPRSYKTYSCYILELLNILNKTCPCTQEIYLMNLALELIIYRWILHISTMNNSCKSKFLPVPLQCQLSFLAIHPSNSSSKFSCTWTYARTSSKRSRCRPSKTRGYFHLTLLKPPSKSRTQTEGIYYSIS